VLKNFERRPVLVKSVDNTWAIDLVDMADLHVDKGYRYILCIIDVLSKYAWAVPLKQKTPKTTLAAIKSVIFSSGRSPEKIWCDRGGEFHGVFAEYFNKEFTESRAMCPYHETCGNTSLLSIPTLIKHFKSNTHKFNDEQIETMRKERFTLTLEDIAKGEHFVSNKMIYHNNPIAAFHVSVVERFNKTLKNIMWYKFTKHGNEKWVDMLPKIINKYNDTINSAIGMKPRKAIHKEKELLEMQQKYKVDNRPFVEPKFELGDRVRTVILKGRFDKGYTQGWSPDIYKIVEINFTKPISYRVERESDKKFIDGSYYKEQLQLTQAPKPPESILPEADLSDQS